MLASGTLGTLRVTERLPLDEDEDEEEGAVIVYSVGWVGVAAVNMKMIVR